MISLPPSVTLEAAAGRGLPMASGQRLAVWSTPSAVDRLRRLIRTDASTGEPDLADDVVWLLAVGGGSLIDRAKVLRAGHPGVKLAVLPTIWGSGAEASPIAVTFENGSRRVRRGPELVPDLIVTHPAFAESLSVERQRHACGDAWAHALEGFLSPLGTDESRADLAGILRRMLSMPLAYSPHWFEVSALACAGQSATSVGVVHGIAHTLEGLVPGGHARLCSLFLLPAMTFNMARSNRWELLARYGLSDHAIMAVLRGLFDPEAYAASLRALRESWTAVLREPCSRTNAALVRQADIEFFESFRI